MSRPLPFAAALLVAAAPLPAQQAAPYRLLATAESDDEVALIAFTPCTGAGVPAGCGARIVRTYGVGLTPSDIEGPHGIVPSPDGRAFFVSLAHGRPAGLLQRIDMATGRQTGLVEVGMFAATVDIGPGGFVYVINFNFEDPAMGVSSLSVVDGATMIEAARTTTCRMPHGSRLNPQGTRHYSGCMMNDLLVEVDARTFAVTRRLGVGPNGAGGERMQSACSPTWAQPSADGATIYVACNRSNEIVAVDVATWRIARRWTTPPAPYNLAVTPDGRFLVATQKSAQSVSVWRLADGVMVADVRTTRRVPSGVVVSADSRYAFVTDEGVGGEPGTVDVIDLAAVTPALVASVDMGKQAGGIAMLP